jgi:hypothetical protein
VPAVSAIVVHAGDVSEIKNNAIPALVNWKSNL